MKESPNYYAVIPAEVRYDENLKDKAKLLYGEITALSNQYGYCYASNKYFANLYKVSPTTISLLIKNLVEFGYLENEIVYREGTKEILNRYLKIVKGGYLRNLKEGYLRNLKDNNINNNNTRINNKEIYKERFKKPTLEEIENYIKEKNMNVNAKTFYNYFTESNWVDSKGNKVKNWKQKLITWNSYNKNTTVEMTPVWFEEALTNEQITLDEQNELENILKEIGE